MLIIVLFFIAKTWKQPKSPSVDEWIKNMVYVYNRILFSHEKEGNPAVAWVELEGIVVSKIHKPLICEI